jgi:hypothetical protein
MSLRFVEEQGAHCSNDHHDVTQHHALALCTGCNKSKSSKAVKHQVQLYEQITGSSD